jgi:heptosyltransferase-1
MQLLIVKMTSLGDVVHMLPALTEAMLHFPDIRVDWVAEESFAAIPTWHPAVQRVIPSALRRWRKHLGVPTTWLEIGQFRDKIRQRQYDLVLDSQCLLKSALVASLARGPVVGLDARSAREPLASLFYGARYAAPKALHAITRNRLLMAQALGYAMTEESAIDYGLTPQPPATITGLYGDYLLCFHGTARVEKEYPEANWIALLKKATKTGLTIALPWGNERERQRAERFAAALPDTVVLPRLRLDQLAGVIAGAKTVLGVDTGLMHLAAAFRRPGIGLYPVTPPQRFGARNEPDAPAMVNLSGAAELEPDEVFRVLSAVMVAPV